ncbi:phosphotransferase [Nocardioides sp.]|uniref:phosphotransferase n=1 Tax=Nocardioides sp. TaxID=35761 RepID=UPI003D0A14AF
MKPYPVPSRSSARRLEWQFLPANLRAYIERKCGSPVNTAVSQNAGFTPGFASVLTCEDGSRHFVKAASVKAQPAFATSYREEARKLSELPSAIPAPQLLWSLDDDWVVLGIEYVEGRHPARPWSSADLERCLDTVADLADRLTPPPVRMDLDTFADEFASVPGHWDHVRATQPGLPHLEEAAALAAGFREVTAGDTVVHTDLRDDNLLIDDDGKVWTCDWNWPVLGASWLDAVFLLIGPRGDGLDVEAVIADRSELSAVPPDHIDRVLALLAGYFLKQRDDPVPPTSPHLRAHQSWHAETCWDWLCERRGWS